MEDLRERNASGSADDHARFARAWNELALDAPAPPRATFACHLAAHAFFLESAAGDLAAYACCRGHGARGDVRQIVVMPAWRGRGVGRELMARVAARLRRAGCADWRLEVKADNARAIALYRGVGMEVLRPLTVLRLPAEVARRAAAPAGHARSAGEGDDQACEAAFDLGRGWIARMRARRPDLSMLRLDLAALAADATTPAGLARWMPDDVNGCGLLWPFRARAPEVVPALLAAALPPGPLPEPIELMAIDAGVAEQLLAAGAKVHERMFEMGAPLPAR